MIERKKSRRMQGLGASVMTSIAFENSSFLLHSHSAHARPIPADRASDAHATIWESVVFRRSDKRDPSTNVLTSDVHLNPVRALRAMWTSARPHDLHGLSVEYVMTNPLKAKRYSQFCRSEQSRAVHSDARTNLDSSNTMAVDELLARKCESSRTVFGNPRSSGLA